MTNDENGARDGRLTAIAECLAGLLNAADCAGVHIVNEDYVGERGRSYVVEGLNGDEWVSVRLRWEGYPAVWRLSETTRAPVFLVPKRVER